MSLQAMRVKSTCRLLQLSAAGHSSKENQQSPYQPAEHMAAMVYFNSQIPETALLHIISCTTESFVLRKTVLHAKPMSCLTYRGFFGGKPP
jgi:hypothetical protein